MVAVWWRGKLADLELVAKVCGLGRGNHRSLGNALAVFSRAVRPAPCIPRRLQRAPSVIGFGRIVASENEAPNMLANLV